MNADDVEAHGVWVTLDDLATMLAGDAEASDAVPRDELIRWHAIVQHISGARRVDAALVQAETVDSINSDLTRARDALRTFLQDTETNQGYLANASAAATSALQNTLRTLPSPPADATAVAAQEALEHYRSAADARIDELRGRIEELNQAVQSSSAENAQRNQEADVSLASLQERIADGDQQVATQTTQLQEQIETQRASFRDEVDQRETAFKQSESERAEAAKTAQNSVADQASAIVDDLEKKREQAAALLKATSDDVISGDYRGWASKQGKTAFWWEVATVAIGLITVGALVWVVLGARNDSTQFLISKSAVGLIGLIVAGYAARQASEHRDEERTANRLALDLAALEPFLENVDDPGKLRAEVARRVFVPESTDEPDRRYWFGRRSMTLTEVAELVKVLRGPSSS